MNSMLRMALNPQQRRNAVAFIAARARKQGRNPRGRAQYASRTMSMTRNGVLGGTNADQRMIYRRKRMPKSKRRRWVRFVKKVQAVDDKELGTQTVLFNDQITQKTGAVASGGQGTLTLALYPFFNSSKGWLDDMNLIHNMDNVGNPTAAAGTTTYTSTKFMFTSAIMDVTVRNISTLAYNEGTQQAPVIVDKLDGQAALELDIYTMTVRKEISDNVSQWASISDLLNSNDDPEIGGTGTGISIQDRGASPFEFGPQMARFGVKILKKQKFFIPNGQTVTFQTRDPKRHVIIKDRLSKTEGFNKPGWTQIFFFIYKLVPGLTQGTSEGTYRAQIAVGVTRKYAYKVEGRTEARERLSGATYTPGIPS